MKTTPANGLGALARPSDPAWSGARLAGRCRLARTSLAEASDTGPALAWAGGQRPVASECVLGPRLTRAQRRAGLAPAVRDYQRSSDRAWRDARTPGGSPRGFPRPTATG